MSYSTSVKFIEWNESKNDYLKAERGVCFEDVVTALEEGRLLSDLKHPDASHYSHQRIFIIAIDGYAYLVPYVEDETKLFLKTMIPSRKATKQYLKGEL